MTKSEPQPPSTKVAELQQKKASLEKNLSNLEKQIYALETSYLEETDHLGNLLRGWDNYLSSRQTAPTHKKKIRDNDRLFSYSSVTAIPDQEKR
mmetsp:Transcript_45845/g.115453  ORF Transcript_45845/g.115453 Transcript_45845/m.115453 type:complete len:94 (+) Transcript_45845:234-515(+)|eukprot:CAMPEP_0177655602 /NCGR_PEP_ID=MMETSP0447-20121125/15070_1 /TAXON_ID=0 /ORGANISM="Stygamoeba regulata, Strain BSH-02190019" /LENGTH=93 /DNA_ID=CAMNT_0019159563 /DNA_START=233 /DNA_END=514 /DNA_ORIENTATION=+